MSLSSDTGFQVMTPTEVASAEEGKDPEQFGFDVGFPALCNIIKSAQTNYQIIRSDSDYQIIRLFDQLDLAQVIIECSGFPPALQQVALLLLGALVALLQCFNC